MKLTAAAAAALALTALAACSSSPDAPHRPTAPTRSDATIPAGMENYAVTQTVLRVSVPGDTPKANAKHATAITDAATKASTLPPTISTTGQTENVIVEHDEEGDGHTDGEAVQTQLVTEVVIGLTTAKDQAAVTRAVKKAAKGAKVTVAHEKVMGLHLRVPLPAGAHPNLDAARPVIDPVLLGGYNLEETPTEINIDYVGGGVTPAGLKAVQAALAKAAGIEPASVAAQPVP